MRRGAATMRREAEKISSGDNLVLSWNIEAPEENGRLMTVKMVYQIYGGDEGEVSSQGSITFNFPKKRVLLCIPESDSLSAHGLAIRKARKHNIMRKNELNETLYGILAGLDAKGLSHKEKCEELERVLIDKDSIISRQLKVAVYRSAVYDVLQNPKNFK